MNKLNIILKHMIWRFRQYKLFREIFKFRGNMSKKTDFAKFIKVFIESRNVDILQK